jgi:hypothetical protein
MFVPRTIVGAALLVFGRKAFWLFVAGVGFVSGLNLARQTFQFESGWIVLGIAIAVGLLGALLALVFQSLGVGLAGFVSGGYVALTLLDATSWGQRLLAGAPSRSWIVFIAGGVLGALLMGVLFDWALIVLSSVLGAMMIAQAIPIQRAGQGVLFVVLVAVGVVVQWIMMQKDRSRRPSSSKKRLDLFG